MRARSAGPLSPSSASLRRLSMSAKPNWPLRCLSSAMRRAMVVAAWHSRENASGSSAASVGCSSANTVKSSGVLSVDLKAALQASSIPSGVNFSQALSNDSGISARGWLAQWRSDSNQPATLASLKVVPLKHPGVASRCARIHASIRFARSIQPSLICASSASCADCSRSINVAMDSTGMAPSKSTRSTSLRIDFCNVAISGQQSRNVASASRSSG